MQFDPEQWLHEHGDVMYRYALKQVRDDQLAQDLVQEAFLAAWRNRDSFDGRSKPRTWLIGILRHKILDAFRKNKREGPATDLETFEHLAETKRFVADGHWDKAPVSWGSDPSAEFETEQFMGVFEQCLGNLPTTMADAFVLRNMDHVETDEVCQILGISATNLYVLLYRARMRLRDCLEKNWFETDQTQPHAAG